MPTEEQLEQIIPILFHIVLPALISAALVMSAIVWIGGARHAFAAAALALLTGTLVGLWMRDVGPMIEAAKQADESPAPAFARLPDLELIPPSESPWNRLPWAILGAVCVGRLARLADVQAGDGWLLRGGAAIAIAWWVLPDYSRDKLIWLAPAFAATMWLQWVILDHLAARPGGSSVALCMALNLLIAGGVVLFAGNMRSMGPLTALAFALFAVWLIACLSGVEVSGAMPAVAVAQPAILLLAFLNTEPVHWSAFALAAFAPLTLALTWPIAHWPTWRLHFIRLLLILIPLVIAIVIAKEAEGDNPWE